MPASQALYTGNYIIYRKLQIKKNSLQRQQNRKGTMSWHLQFCRESIGLRPRELVPREADSMSLHLDSSGVKSSPCDAARSFHYHPIIWSNARRLLHSVIPSHSIHRIVLIHFEPRASGGIQVHLIIFNMPKIKLYIWCCHSFVHHCKYIQTCIYFKCNIILCISISDCKK